MKQIEDLASKYSDATIEVVAKGGKFVQAHVPRSILAATLQFIDGERALFATPNRISRTPSDGNDSLFLNTRGEAVTRDCFYAAFKRACSRISLVAHPHQARTTFATHMERRLATLRDSGVRIDPIKVVQWLLGHASSETTAIYLESISRPNVDVMKILNEFSSEIGGAST